MGKRASRLVQFIVSLLLILHFGKMKKKLLYLSSGVLIFILTFAVYFVFRVSIDEPQPKSLTTMDLPREKLGEDFYKCGDNWIKKNQFGLWEMYIEGDAFERGVMHGKLAQELVEKQEVHFIGQIKKIVPNESYLKFLKYFIAWFNRDLDKNIKDEYKMEIYGVSRYASPEYQFIGSNYQRILNYHAAHDIGHALQDKNMVVGCTSFSVWDEASQDSSLIVGRNFDFFVGDDFAEDKIIAFVDPTEGHQMMMVTWGGMTGVVSGMNMEGLTVTINAGKSDIPTKSATPISVLSREILQYASNIEEAIAIAEKSHVFVAEAIMVSSAKDGKTVIIEKSPTKMGVKYPDESRVVCSNHFQSELYSKDSINVINQQESSSGYRYQRVIELLDEKGPLDQNTAAEILRNRLGVDDQEVGMGNELALNQLLAHHSIIFKPEQRKVWVSSSPWQLGSYVCYDLNKVFAEEKFDPAKGNVFEDSLTISEDSFLKEKGYQDFMTFRQIKNRVTWWNMGFGEGPVTGATLDSLVALNPNYYHAHVMAGNGYKELGQKEKAVECLQAALKLPIATEGERRAIQESLAELTE